MITCLGEQPAVAKEAQIPIRERIVRGLAVLWGFVVSTPFEALLFAPFTFLNYRAAYISWVLISVGLLVCAAMIIESNTNLISAVSQYARMRADFGLVLVLFMTFAPVTACLLLGQDSPLLLLMFTLTFVLLRRRCAARAGSGFAPEMVFPAGVRASWSYVDFDFHLGLRAVVLEVYPRFLLLNPIYQQVAGFAPEYMPNRGFAHLFFDGRAAVISALSGGKRAQRRLYGLWRRIGTTSSSGSPFGGGSRVSAGRLSSLQLRSDFAVASHFNPLRRVGQARAFAFQAGAARRPNCVVRSATASFASAA